MVSFYKTRLAVLFINILLIYAKINGKVLNGGSEDLSKYSHAVYMQITFGSGHAYYCGATIVNQKVLITAAHCVAAAEKKFDIQCLAGAIFLDQAQVIKKVKSIKRHKDFNMRTMFADLALLTLNEELPLGARIKRVIIRPSFPDNPLAEVAGWGYLDEIQPKIKKLRHAQQMIWNARDCNKKVNLIRGTMCVLAIEGHPMYGDSGSSLISDEFQLLGIVSYRARKHDLLIYTNASYYYRWIKEKSQEIYCDA